MTSSSPYCAKCGGKNEPGAQVCFACGESLLAAEAASSSAAAAPRATLQLPMSARLLKQRYRIVQRVGEGGFGAVYQAEDVDLGNRLVAVKEMQPSGLRPQEVQEATEAFHREAILLAGLSHRSLPRIYDHFSEDGHWYLVMEFIHGETLEKRLERSPRKHLSVRESLQLAIKLCEVLEYLHTRPTPIIFRDLKPANVMLTPDDAVYLIDFGIARLFKPGQQKDTVAFGTSGYAAPEQYGKAQTTPRSDVFSLGALLHHMLTGNDPSDTPFRFEPLTMPRPTGLGTFIGHMVSLDEYKRPPSMGIVKRELERLAAAWEERQRGQTTTMNFPPYQAATGFLPVVPPPRPPGPGAVPMQPGPHWMPPPVSILPGQQKNVPSVFQPSSLIRVAGPPLPVLPPSASPAANAARNRRALKLLILLLVIVVLLFLIGGMAFGLMAGSVFFARPSAVHDSLYAVAWSPNGQLLAAAGKNGQIRLWDTNGNWLGTYPDNGASIDWLAWSPDGTYLAAAGDDGVVQVWDTSSGTLRYTYRGHGERVSGLAWSPDSKRIASSSDDQTVRAWDATTGAHEYTYDKHNAEVWTVGWSPDGQKIASGDAAGIVQVWNAANGTSIARYDNRGIGINHLAWSPDNKHLALVGADDRTVKVWDSTNPDTAPLVYSEHTATVDTVAWSPDGKYLASGGEDAAVRVWDATGTTQYVYRGHKNAVWALAWLPTSEGEYRIASIGAEGAVQVWDALTGNNAFSYALSS